MPLQKRWAVLVEIGDTRSHGIFRIDLRGEFAGALENPRSSMFFYQRLQQQTYSLRMEIVADQYADTGRDERHVIRWNVRRDIKHALGQTQPNEVGEDTGERLGPCEAHEPDVGHSQHGLDGWRFRRAGDPIG